MSLSSSDFLLISIFPSNCLLKIATCLGLPQTLHKTEHLSLPKPTPSYIPTLVNSTNTQIPKLKTRESPKTPLFHLPNTWIPLVNTMNYCNAFTPSSVNTSGSFSTMLPERSSYI